jgi:hypothetical protein
MTINVFFQFEHALSFKKHISVSGQYWPKLGDFFRVGNTHRTDGTCPHTAKNQYRKLEKIFPEKELRGHSPNYHIHVSVSDLYIPTIDLPILLQEICGPILELYKSLTD